MSRCVKCEGWRLSTNDEIDLQFVEDGMSLVIDRTCGREGDEDYLRANVTIGDRGSFYGLVGVSPQNLRKAALALLAFADLLRGDSQ